MAKNNVLLIKSALNDIRFGNEIIVAEDGEEALDFIFKGGKFSVYREGEPIFILLDI